MSFLLEVLAWARENPKTTALLILLLGSNFATCHYTEQNVAAVYQSKLDRVDADRAEELARMLTEKNNLIAKLQLEKKHEQTLNAAAAADLASVRVRLGTCQATVRTAPSPDRSAHDSAGAGVLPEQPQDRLDRVVENFKRRAAEADEIVANCRVVTKSIIEGESK